MNKREVLEKIQDLISQEIPKDMRLSTEELYELISETMNNSTPKIGTFVLWRSKNIDFWDVGRVCKNGIAVIGMSGVFAFDDVEWKVLRILSDKEEA